MSIGKILLSGIAKPFRRLQSIHRYTFALFVAESESDLSGEILLGGFTRPLHRHRITNTNRFAFIRRALVSSLWREEASLLSRNFHRRPRVGIETEARLQNWRKSAKSAELSRHGDGRWRNLGSSNKKVSHMPLKTFTSVFLALTLIAFAAEPSDENEEEWLRPRFLSPDGRYALLVTEDPGGDSEKERVELIELATKRVLVPLREAGDDYNIGKKAKLDWSADSQRVAAYAGWKRGGMTRLFMREGDTFSEVKLPELPNLPDEPSGAMAKNTKRVFPRGSRSMISPFVRWLKSGGVVLELSDSWGGESGTWGWHITITVDIDSHRQATIKKVEKKETFDKS